MVTGPSGAPGTGSGTASTSARPSRGAGRTVWALSASSAPTTPGSCTASDAPGNVGFAAIRRRAPGAALPPSRGGDETAYLHAFLDARVAAITQEPSHTDTSRIDTARRAFLPEGNPRLDPPLAWKAYGDTYRIEESACGGGGGGG